MRNSKTASFFVNNREYVCTLTETRGAIAPYKLDVIEDGDELHLDSDFKSWNEDIWSNFDSLIDDETFQNRIINSSWWEYNG